MPKIAIALSRATLDGSRIQYPEDRFAVKPLADGEMLERISLTVDGLPLLDIPLGMIATRQPAEGLIVPLPDYPED